MKITSRCLGLHLMFVLPVSVLTACGGGSGASASSSPSSALTSSGVTNTNPGNSPSGTIAASSVSLHTGAWGDLGNLATATNMYIPSTVVNNDIIPAIVAPVQTMDAAGNLTVIWPVPENNNYVLQTARFTRSNSSWSAVQPLDTTQTKAANGLEKNGSMSPVLLADAQGNVMAVWSVTGATALGSPIAMVSRLFNAASGTWGALQILSSTMPAVTPQLVVNAQGEFALVWSAYTASAAQSSGTSMGIWTSVYQPSTGWSSPLEVDNNVTGETSGMPQAVMDAQGNITIAWIKLNATQAGTTPAQILLARRYQNGQWGSVQQVDRNVANPGSDAPSLVVDSQGNVTVAWSQATSADYNLNPLNSVINVSRLSPSSSQWTPPTTVVQAYCAPAQGIISGSTPPCQGTQGAKLAIDAQDRIMLSWLQSSSGANYPTINNGEGLNGQLYASPLLVTSSSVVATQSQLIDAGQAWGGVNKPLISMAGQPALVWLGASANLGISAPIEMSSYSWSTASWSSVQRVDIADQGKSYVAQSPQFNGDARGDMASTWLDFQNGGVVLQAAYFLAP